MAMATLTTPSPCKLPDLPKTYDIRFRGPSFSSFPDSNEESVIQELADTAPHGRRFGPLEQRGDHVYDDDGEIGVFEAEKYFNGGIDENSLRLARIIPPQLQPKPVKPEASRRSATTPSTRSDVSWKSQTLLLQRNPSRMKGGEVKSKSPLANVIRCCNDKDSVNIDVSDGRDRGVARGQPRFYSEKRRLMPTWNNVVPGKEESTLDSGSDASSDLFEIESLTGKANPLPMGHDAASAGPVTPTAYAPSEVSVEWSVVTASAEFSSAISDDWSDPAGASTPARRPAGTTAPSGKKSLKERPRSGILMGCKSRKATRVAGDHSHRICEMNEAEANVVRSVSFPSVGKHSEFSSISRLHRPSSMDPRFLYIKQARRI